MEGRFISDFNLEENFIKNELAIKINDVISFLPEEERKLFIDKYLMELSTNELCEKYFISEDALYKRLSRLRKKFKQIWNEKYISEEEC